MDKERMTTIGRNVLWALILVAALVWGINSGDWRHFITLAILFGISKSLLLWGNLKLRRETARLKGMLEEQGRPTFVPEPEVLDAMQKKADAIVSEINRLCPPRQCLRFCINYNRKPTVLDTKLGGTPYWDSAMPYPTDAKGKEMALVLQVNFEQCPHLEPLPQEGMLQYFISIDDEILESGYGEDSDNPTSQANFRVVYHRRLDQHRDEKRLAKYPRIETTKYAPVAAEYAVDVRQEESCINETCNGFETLAQKAVKNLYGKEMDSNYVSDEVKKILPEEKRDEVDDDLATNNNPMFWGVTENNFQMLGFPAFEQYDNREKGSRHDTLLLQIPTIETGSAVEDNHQFHTIWGDCGSVRLFINADDLRRLDFSSIFYESQCY